MSWKQFSVCHLMMAVVACSAVTAAAAEEAADKQFQRGFYLENHENDPAGALTAYETVLALREAPEALRDEAKVRAARCQEDLRTGDLARLMPADTCAYIEVSRPGQHVSQLAELLGLVLPPTKTRAAGVPGGVNLGGGIFLPDDLSLSPALTAELEKVRGIAIAVTSIDPKGSPHGVAVLHPGESDLVRGLIETGIQLLEPGEPIGGFRTYCVEQEVWIAATHRLLVISPCRDLLAATIGRLDGEGSESLATVPGFADLQDQREDSLIFVYVSGPSVVQALEQQVPGQELQMARTALDLDHLQNLSAALRTTESDIQLQVKLDLEPGHHNMLHGLVQTAPITKQSLQHVPAESAAVVVLGLNPAKPAPPSDGAVTPTFSLMDLGRELFANIVEASAFVLPANAGSPTGPPVPEVGVVLAVREPGKSEALWNQLLTLPAMFGAPGVSAPRDIKIQGQTAKEFRFPNAPPIVLAQLEHRALIVGTPGAVAAAIATGRSAKSIGSDAPTGASFRTLTPSSSKAVYVHGGRALDVAISANPGLAQEIGPARCLVDTLVATLVMDEQPNALCFRASITGLPNVPEIAKKAAHDPRSPFGRRRVVAAGWRR